LRRLLCSISLLALIVIATSTRAADPAPAALGVAEFEKVPPASAEVPDVGALLADRLAAQGVGRVIGPARLGAPSSAEPTDEEVRGIAARNRVGGIVVGRATRSGEGLGIEARLRSGEKGSVVGTYVAEVSRPEDLAPVVGRLAEQIVSKGLPALAASSQKSEVASSSGSSPRGLAPGAALPIDVGGLKKDAPLDIQSDELEAFSNDKSRRFLFTGNVRVKQDVMTLKADRLEAFYPPEGNEPDRLVATGRVVVTQKDQEARCDAATYMKLEQRIFCRGNAELRQGEDRVRGREIEIRLDSEQLIVRGGAEVHIQPRQGEGPAAVGKQGS
jgi:lipopolysaccharide export system protein LptA